MENIGFIGLGAMGKPMAKNLIEAGYHLTVLDIREDAVKDLVQLGAVPSKIPKEVAESSWITITMLRDSMQVEGVTLGKDSIIEGIEKGKIYIDMSTINPIVTKKLAEKIESKGGQMLDAPVSGGVKGAQQGTLTIMVGGKKATLNECLKVLQALGKTVYHIGDIGMGVTIKVVNNLLNGIFTVALGEALVLGVKIGIEPKTLVEIITKSSGSCWVLENEQWFLQGDFSARFTTDLHKKDLSIAVEMASKLNIPLDLGSTAYRRYTEAVEAGFGQEDHTSVIKLAENLAGVKVREHSK
jgi:3-hydroxyisobutyrate dehydrogenase